MRRDLKVRQLESEDISSCERILHSLPDWFGIEKANEAYIKSLSSLPAYVAVINDEVVGFIAAKLHNDLSAEIHVLAVEAGLHRQGVGQALVHRIESCLKKHGVVLLQVKTLGPSRPDEGYHRTRMFYEALGFLPLEETTSFWGPEQPCLILVKCLSR
jgi:GNAT superfamily N-acetyltransferase